MSITTRDWESKANYHKSLFRLDKSNQIQNGISIDFLPANNIQTKKGNTSLENLKNFPKKNTIGVEPCSNVEKIKEESYFFRLSNWQNNLLDFYEKNGCSQKDH